MDHQLIAGEIREKGSRQKTVTASTQKEHHAEALHLQRAVGNSASAPILQTKLSLGAPGDRYEQEADRVAEQVVGGGGAPGLLSDGSGTVRRACAACSGGAAPCRECAEEEKVQRTPAPPVITPIVQRAADTKEPEEEEEMVQGKEASGMESQLSAPQEQAINALRGGGSPLAPDVRQFMEPRFGRDFGGVRIHTDARAAESARSIGALAYTVGRDVVFGAGMYNPDAADGKRLLAHELTHVVQQGASGATHGNSVVAGSSAAPARNATPRGTAVESRAPVASMVQRQTPPAPVCPSSVTFSRRDPVHVPACGNQPFIARTNAPTATWSLAAGTAAIGPGTSIAANGTITIGATQPAGDVTVVATEPTTGCNFSQPLRVRSHPTGIANTTMVSIAPGGGTDYGAVFEHTFISNDGQVASLENVGVGERFIGVPTPTAATHAITSPTNPFGGTFTLNTATLTAAANNNWFLTAAGELGGTHDTVTIARAGINVGRFIQSTSNPTPPNGTLPATMTVVQGLHWFCPQSTVNDGWTAAPFVRVAHSRTLRNVGGNVEFVTTVNGLEVPETYSGPVGVFNVTASPVSTPHSVAPPAAPVPTPAAPGGGAPAPVAPAPRTVTITADTLPTALPALAPLSFTIRGAALGCTIAPSTTDPHAGILTVGTTAGTVTVRVADNTGVNFSDVSIVIT